ncbi:hypothetical protein RBH89_25085 [Paracidovorax avenae]
MSAPAAQADRRAAWALAACVAGGALPTLASPHLPLAAPPAATDPGFSTPDRRQLPGVAVLQAFLATLGRPQGTQRFCFVVERMPADPATPEPRQVLHMVWATGSRLYTLPWPPHAEDRGENPVFAGQALAWTRSADLRNGVVDTDAERFGSSFLVTRAWADRITRQCRRSGVPVWIVPDRRPALSPARPAPAG